LRGSEGDDVVAEAWLSPEPGPVVVAGHGAESDRNAPYITGAAKAWAGRGLSVVAADAPLHGDRATGVPHPEMHDAGRADFIARAAADVRCLADAVEDRLGPRSLGYLGFSMGTQYGVQAVAADQRFRAAVFAVGGSATVAIRERFEDSSIALHEEPVPSDPVRFASAVSPRPVLMVNADGDEIFSRRAALALYDAFGVPKEITFFPGRHVDWRSPGQWYRRMEAFAREHLAGVSGERRSGMGP
jgi:dienelactone hydrolase